MNVQDSDVVMFAFRVAVLAESYNADVRKAGLHYLEELAHIHLQARPALVPPASGA